MFNQEQVINGILAYIRKEMLPVLPATAKALGGAVLLHNAGRISEIKLDSGTMKAIGLVTDGGNIDVDIWCQDIKRSMHDFCDGKLIIQIPLLQPIILYESDIDTMKRYIKGELQ